MSEQFTPNQQDSSLDPREAYQTEYDTNPEWADVKERIDIIQIPVDVHERAEDVARHFSGADDIRAFVAALHQVVVPSYRTQETDFAMHVGDKSGESKTSLAEPAERSAMFDAAGKFITELNSLRAADGTEDEAFLERAGNIVALSSLLAHSYADGNGRTARVAGDLLRYGPESENLEVAAKSRDSVAVNEIRINSYVPKSELTAYETIEAAAGLDTPLSDTAAYRQSAQDAFTTPYA